MVSNEIEHVVLISIHPEFAEAILHGVKRVEFRKTRMARPFKMIAIYATFPVCKIVGICHVSEIHEAPPPALWKRHRKEAGIDHARFIRYFNGSPQGIALVLSGVIPLEVPLPLSKVSGNPRPPQSFVYLSKCKLPETLANKW